jgi:hypothetical protein
MRGVEQPDQPELCASAASQSTQTATREIFYILGAAAPHVRSGLVSLALADQPDAGLPSSALSGAVEFPYVLEAVAG